ncbi:MAG: GNAT family N-acetyltransferase [Chloroflexota bacterium]
MEHQAVIHPLTQLELDDLVRIASGYSSHNQYVVAHLDTPTAVSFEMELVTLTEPYIKKYKHEPDDFVRYQTCLKENYSFGAYVDEELIGILICEPHHWNQSLWVYEYHVAEGFRNLGIGRNLMDALVEKGEGENFRTIVCETQNTNVPAISVYRKLGFQVAGIDISYYSNYDYPDGEVAVFMKRELL